MKKYPLSFLFFCNNFVITVLWVFLLYPKEMILSPYIFIDIRHIPLHVSLTHNPQYTQINIPYGNCNVRNDTKIYPVNDTVGVYVSYILVKKILWALNAYRRKRNWINIEICHKQKRPPIYFLFWIYCILLQTQNVMMRVSLKDTRDAIGACRIFYR